jgi:AraC-like DNA-binding protein/ligand-binding sensor protein
MSKTSNIIQRRDLNPLLIKACEIVRYYEKAADCTVSVLGPDCNSVDEAKHSGTIFFCAFCRHFCRQAGRELAPSEYPCAALHFNAVKEARRLGGSYIYTCPVGFIFWTSPFYSGERFAGALVSSGILAVEQRQAVEKIFRVCGGKLPREEIERYLERIPAKTSDEVKALAQMMLICAEQISGGENRPIWPARYAERNETPAGSSSGDDIYPLDKERMLLASLRRGDNEEAVKILKELLKALYKSGGGNFEYFKLRAIELVVLLSRAAADGEDTEDANTLEATSRYLKKIEDSRNAEEITENLCFIINRMSGKLFSFQGIRHASALRKAERFIWENYTRKISLREVASASGLSAPYFSTVFKEEMGENLSNYLNRLRVEKAAAMLRETGFSISEIAAACGFEDQSWFSKIFKTHAGCSPGKYREHGDATEKFVLRPQRSMPVSPADFN